MGLEVTVFEALSKQGLEPEEGVLSQRTAMVAGGLFPGFSSLLLDLLEKLIARVELAVRILAPRNGTFPWRNQRLGLTFRDGLMTGFRIIGTIGEDLRNGFFHLNQQLRRRFPIADKVRGQFTSGHLLTVRVHRRMQFAPGAASPGAV